MKSDQLISAWANDASDAQLVRARKAMVRGINIVDLHLDGRRIERTRGRSASYLWARFGRFIFPTLCAVYVGVLITCAVLLVVL